MIRRRLSLPSDQPVLPVEGRRAAAILGAMLVASGVLLAVADRQVQYFVALVVVLGGTGLLIAGGRRRAEQLGVRSARDLPPVPLLPRVVSGALAIGGVAVLVAFDELLTAWWAVLITLVFIADDLARRRVFRGVLRGEALTSPQPPPGRRQLLANWAVVFVVSGAGFGGFTAAAQTVPPLGAALEGLFFGTVMTVLQIRRDRRAREPRE